MKKFRIITIIMMITMAMMVTGMTIQAKTKTYYCNAELTIHKSKYPMYIYQISSGSNCDNYSVKIYSDKKCKNVVSTAGFNQSDIDNDKAWNCYKTNSTIYLRVSGSKGKTTYKAKYTYKITKSGTITKTKI